MGLRRCIGVVLCIAACAALSGRKAEGAETVNIITLPTAVSFAVTNVSISTTGAPNPSTIAYDSLKVLGRHALRISLQATAAGFTPPAGIATIPASNVSWTTSNAIHGTGFSGTLSSVAYVVVFQSDIAYVSGGVDLTWQLAAPGASIRAGNHTLVARWKLESIVP